MGDLLAQIIMKVKIEFYATFREKYGKGLVIESSHSIYDAMKAAARVLRGSFLKDIYDDKGNFRIDVMITVNGRNLLDMKHEVVLKEGDRIAIYPPVAGG